MCSEEIAADVARQSLALSRVPFRSYGFRAHYNGDTNFDASTSDCEPFHVNTAASSTATELHNNANEAVIARSEERRVGKEGKARATVYDSDDSREPTGDGS